MFKLPMFRPLARYAEFNGRSNRAEFWLFLLLYYAVTALFYALIYVTSLRNGHFDLDLFLPHYMQFSPILSLFSLGLLVPYLAVAVRRLHDTGRTGWWLLLPVVVSIIGYMAFFVFKGQEFVSIMMNVAEGMRDLPMESPAAAMNPLPILKLEWPLFELMLPWAILPSLAGQLLILFFCALPGEPGDNRFGPPPAKG